MLFHALPVVRAICSPAADAKMLILGSRRYHARPAGIERQYGRLAEFRRCLQMPPGDVMIYFTPSDDASFFLISPAAFSRIYRSCHSPTFRVTAYTHITIILLLAAMKAA